MDYNCYAPMLSAMLMQLLRGYGPVLCAYTGFIMPYAICYAPAAMFDCQGMSLLYAPKLSATPFLCDIQY
eukprot:3360261-Rhodomonas_salina.1